jgi:hypothetical protein
VNAAKERSVVLELAPSDAGKRLFLKGLYMLALSRRVVTALTLGCGLSAMLTITQPGWAATDIGEGAQSVGAVPCVIGHRFEPGPIVGGHNRQPTPAEFDARTRELNAWSQGGAGSCSSPPF